MPGTHGPASRPEAQPHCGHQTGSSRRCTHAAADERGSRRRPVRVSKRADGGAGWFRLHGPGARRVAQCGRRNFARLMPGLLLDTCAIIYVAENHAIDPTARQEIAAASVGGGVLVSTESVWEIGLLAAKRG